MYCGQLGLGTPASQIETVRQADVILAVGTRLSEVTTQDYSLINPEQTLIHLDIEANVLGKVYPPALGLVADAKTAFDSLNKEVEVWDSSRWSSWGKERKEVFIQSSRMDEIDEAPWSIGYKEVIQVFNELCPKEAVITNDAGNFAAWLQNFHSFTGKKSYAAPTSGAMGYGFPAGVGAKIANSERPVVVFAGDGGFMMTLQEIETAARNHIPVIVLLFNNSSYGTIRMHQERVYPDRVIGTELSDVNYTMMAEAMGAIGVTADSAENFRSVFKEALHENVRPTIIELKMNPKQVSIGMKL
jgi:acetolactate synthase-1/2/3 large subunit